MPNQLSLHRTRRKVSSTKPKMPPSPIANTRSVKAPVQLQLYVEAGGRCEFDGCNEYLLEHQLTLKRGNYGEAAHVVAFKAKGPRGEDGLRPQNINEVKNLMLLCPRCHKLIDDHPNDYSRETLIEYKRAHESRIKFVTALGPEQKTAVLVLKAPINGHAVSIPFDHIVEATAPQYPASREPETIDLTKLVDSGELFMRSAKENIEHVLDDFLGRRGEGRNIGHVSIFALAPIPLLVFLGSRLTNKIPTEVFQRHRDTERWAWQTKSSGVRYTVSLTHKGENKKRVALVLSLSGSIKHEDLPAEIKSSAYIYTITLEGVTPNPTFLKTKQDLEGFRIIYQEALGLIAKQHGLIPTIELFPAVPAPVAILCGRELLPKVHPMFRIWDYNKAKDGFTYQFNLNEYE